MRRSLFIFALSMLLVSAGALSGWAQDEQVSDQDDQAAEEAVTDDEGGGEVFRSILVDLPNGLIGAAGGIVTWVGENAGGLAGWALGVKELDATRELVINGVSNLGRAAKG